MLTPTMAFPSIALDAIQGAYGKDLVLALTYCTVNSFLFFILDP